MKIFSAKFVTKYRLVLITEKPATQKRLCSLSQIFIRVPSLLILTYLAVLQLAATAEQGWVILLRWLYQLLSD